MNKQRFSQVVKVFHDLSPDDRNKLHDLAKSYPYSQIIHTLVAKANKDADTDIAQQTLNYAAMYATDRAVLKQVIESQPLVNKPAEPEIQAIEPKTKEQKAASGSESQDPQTTKSKKVTVDSDTLHDHSDKLIDEVWSDLEALKKSKASYLEKEPVTATAHTDASGDSKSEVPAPPTKKTTTTKKVTPGTKSASTKKVAPSKTESTKRTRATKRTAATKSTPTKKTPPKKTTVPKTKSAVTKSAATTKKTTAARSTTAKKVTTTTKKVAATTKKTATTKTKTGVASKKSSSTRARSSASKATSARATTTKAAKAGTTTAKKTAKSATTAKKRADAKSDSKTEPPASKKKANTKSESLKINKQKEIIEKFIDDKPRIAPKTVKGSGTDQKDLSVNSTAFGENLISENLARILIAQGKKEKAVDIYKKLIWKFPQKKTYFASLIEDLQK